MTILPPPAPDCHQARLVHLRAAVSRKTDTGTVARTEFEFADRIISSSRYLFALLGAGAPANTYAPNFLVGLRRTAQSARRLS
jgi:hypothetical protein